MSDPFLSVVIPTYNGLAKLGWILNSLSRQNISRKSFEVVIVDDGSEFSDKEIKYNYLLRDYPKLNTRIIYHEKNLGPAAARNTGIKNSTGDIVFFTDDDCEVPANWMEEHLKIYNEKPEISAVGGWYKPNIKDESGNIFSLFMLLNYINSFGLSFYNTYGPSPDYPFYSFPGINTANLSVKRYVLDDVLFDEDFITPGFEDGFFSEKIRGRSYLIYYIPQFVTDKKVMGFKSFLSFCRNRGVGAFVYEKKYSIRLLPFSRKEFAEKLSVIDDFSRIIPAIKRKKIRLIMLLIVRLFITHSSVTRFYYRMKYLRKRGYIPIKIGL